mgnify:CR=1 FL=1
MSELNLQPHAVHREDRADGTVILTSALEHGPGLENTGDW